MKRQRMQGSVARSALKVLASRPLELIDLWGQYYNGRVPGLERKRGVEWHVNEQWPVWS